MEQPTTAGSWLQGIWNMLSSIGMDPLPIFRQAGIEPDAFRDPHARFESDQLSRLWNVITEVAGDDAIALAASDQPRPATLDLLGYTMMTAPTMEAALLRFIRYIRVISEATTFTLEPDVAGGQWLRLAVAGGALPVPRQRCEFILITILNICRWIGSKPIAPLAIEFVYPEPGSTQAHARAFGGPLRFGAARNGLWFSAEDLALQLPASNPQLAALHERFAVEFIDRMDKSRLAPKVRGLIARMLPDGDPPRAAVADALCMSERTLQRRLQDEGVSYQELVDGTRKALAGEYLLKGDMALGQVAFMLGFGDQSAFTRACQRWFNKSPKQVRQGG